MANKDHSLDDKIIKASMEEFLNFGFEKASLRKIASNADVTIGAIYTRYPNKDKLFCSLCEPLIKNIAIAFEELGKSYHMVEDMQHTDFINTMRLENDTVLHLLFDDYAVAKLLLLKSRGSSLENFFDTIVEKKISSTLSFFKSANTVHPNETVLKMIISSQFYTYYQIINEGMDLKDAKEIMNGLMVYHLAGWKALLNL